MVSRPPTPPQRANDRITEAIAGSHTHPTTRTVGMATIRTRKIRSVPDTRTRPPERRGGGGAPGGGPRRGGSPREGGQIGHRRLLRSTTPPASGGEDGLLLALQALGQPVDVVRLLEEGLAAGGHYRCRGVGAA